MAAHLGIGLQDSPVIDRILDLGVRQQIVEPAVRLVVYHVERKPEVRRSFPYVCVRHGKETPTLISAGACALADGRVTAKARASAASATMIGLKPCVAMVDRLPWDASWDASSRSVYDFSFSPCFLKTRGKKLGQHGNN